MQILTRYGFRKNTFYLITVMNSRDGAPLAEVCSVSYFWSVFMATVDQILIFSQKYKQWKTGKARCWLRLQIPITSVNQTATATRILSMKLWSIPCPCCALGSWMWFWPHTFGFSVSPHHPFTPCPSQTFTLQYRLPAFRLKAPGLIFCTCTLL